MEKLTLKKTISSVVASFMCLSSVPFAATQLDASADASVGETLTITGADQRKGIANDGYSYEIWQEDTNETSSMKLGDKGTFTTSWNCSGVKGNFLARRGVRYDDKKPWQDYGEFSLDFDVDWQASSNGNSRVCVYGWTQNPLVEYYIVEDWANWCPPSGSPGAGSPKGSFSVDGATYYIYTEARNSYTIEGFKDFTQYYSVRSTPRHSGTISVSEHFKAWENAGLKMGTLYEVALNIEGWESSGSATVNKNTLTIGGDPKPTDPPPEPDPDGNYLTCDFDSSTDNWKGRGDGKVSTDTGSYYEGGQSLKITNRGNNWHGAAITLDSSTFVAGNSYSFDIAALQTSGSPVTLQLTLQQGSGNSATYTKIADAVAESGEWTALNNKSFKIPSGSGEMILYIESPDSLTDIWIDSLSVGVDGNAGKIVTGQGIVEGMVVPPPVGLIKGDFTGDQVLNTFDLIAGRQAIVEAMSGTSNPVSLAVSDTNGSGTFEINDIVTLAQYLLGKIKEFPAGSAPATTTAVTTSPIRTTTPTPQPSGDFMGQIADDMQIYAPSDFTQNKAGVDYGKMEDVTYYSKDGQMNKKMKVLLPAGYNTNEKYPVLYVLHGIFGDETSMPGMGVQTMVGNLIANGSAEKMIVVFPAMFTGSGSPGFTSDAARKYDLIREDIENSIMPYLEEHYSIKTGRENTAITGFSMGGREALYTGITRSELYGYIGAACPAPGIFETTDGYMHHEGNMVESQFKPSTSPYMLLISAAQHDGTVGTYPESYHNALTSNSVQHLWQIIPQGDHGSATVNPHMYNFLRYIFKAT